MFQGLCSLSIHCKATLPWCSALSSLPMQSAQGNNYAGTQTVNYSKTSLHSLIAMSVSTLHIAHCPQAAAYSCLGQHFWYMCPLSGTAGGHRDKQCCAEQRLRLGAWYTLHQQLIGHCGACLGADEVSDGAGCPVKPDCMCVRAAVQGRPVSVGHWDRPWRRQAHHSERSGDLSLCHSNVPMHAIGCVPDRQSVRDCQSVAWVEQAHKSLSASACVCEVILHRWITWSAI